MENDTGYINGELMSVDQSKQDLTMYKGNVNLSDLPPYWEAEYINEKIDEETNPKYQMFFRTLWITGCRVTEAINIRKRDIDFTNYVMEIRWLKNRKYHTRRIPLHPKLRDLLQMFTASIKHDELLFDFSRQRAYQIVKRRFNGNPHMFRHSFAVQWLRCDGRIEILSQMLGHSDIKTTMIYQKIVPVDQGRELLKVKF